MKNKFLKVGLLSGILLTELLTGCASRFGETHYFSSTDTQTGEVVNVFRLRVSGGSDFSNARYLAGYYDERAVDIFFNEVDSGSYDITTDRLPGVGPIFTTCKDADDAATCKARYDKKIAVSPLGSGTADEHKAFVLILSTRADAISETIGAIASDNVMKQTLFRMANKDTFDKKAELEAVSDANIKARTIMVAELDALFKDGGALASGAGTQADYLAVLASLAGGLSPNAPVRFNTFGEAENWFNAYQIGGGL